MKRPEYRLRVVQMLSELRQKAAMRALAEKSQAAERLQRDLQAVREALERARADLHQARLTLSRVGESQPVDARTLLMLCRDVEALEQNVTARRRDIDRKHRELRKAVDEVERARRALANAVRAVQALKQHHARWLAEVTAEEQRAEDRELAEHGLMLWMRRGDGGEAP